MSAATRYDQIKAAYQQELDKHPKFTREDLSEAANVVSAVVRSFKVYIGAPVTRILPDENYLDTSPGFFNIRQGMSINSDREVAFALSIDIANGIAVWCPMRVRHDRSAHITSVRKQGEPDWVSMPDNGALHALYERIAEHLTERAREKGQHPQ